MVLDSASSVDPFANPAFLQDIKEAPKQNTVHTNGGPVEISQQGTLPSFGMVPYHHDGLTNITSLAKATDKYRITFDSAVDNAFYVHTPQKVVRFARNDSNLYVHKPTNVPKKTPPPKATAFVQTVAENLKFHTPREIKRAKRARDLLAALGTPRIADLKAAIAMNAMSILLSTQKMWIWLPRHSDQTSVP